VIGATGFLARHLIPALRRTDKWEVVGAAASDHAPPWLAANHYHVADIASQDAVLKLMDRVAPDALVQAAGRVHGSAQDLCRTNVVGTANVLAAARQQRPACRLILVGSAAEYGPVSESALPITEDAACAPADAYGVTKLAATELAVEAARAWGARTTVVRPFNMVGAHMPAYLLGGALVERVYSAVGTAALQPVRIGRTDTRRDFVAVEDVVSALMKLLEIDAPGEIYNLCSGRPTAITELLRLLVELSGADLRWETDPTLVRAGDVQTSYGSSEKARNRFGFEATVPLDSALRAAWNAKSGSPGP